MTLGKGLRLLFVAALTPPLLYYVGDLLLGDGMWPVWHWMLPATGLAAAGLAGTAIVLWRPERVNSLLRGSEILARYCMAYLLMFYAFNKIFPGQFRLYNRDLDLAVRDLPARRLAWHFLGHSLLYVGFMAALELLAGVLLCWSRTALGGLLLTAGLTLNIVMIDLAFGILAVPIAATMASAALVMIAGRLETLRPLRWRSRGTTASASWTRHDLLSLGALVVIVGLTMNQNIGSRRGLMSQLPPAGRWEVVECSPDPGLAMCQPRVGGTRAVLYLEIGHWGEVVTESERRSLKFSYDNANKELEIRIQPRDSAAEPILILRGTVAEADTSVLLQASAPSIPPFEVRLRRTHYAPW